MNIQAFNAAANRLELRTDTARQILEELGYGDMTIPMQSFNDDDYYEYNPISKELVGSYGCKSPQPTARPGFVIARGMRAKYLGLWRVQS
jgi:hypothetical protein